MRLPILAMLLLACVVAAEPTQREIKGTELLVQSELAALEAPASEVMYQPSAKLAVVFPTYLFVLAHFPNTAEPELPPPLKQCNLYAVGPQGNPKLLATPQDVLDLFKACKPIMTADDVKKAIEAALALESAKCPNQPFAPSDDVKVTPDGMGGFTGSGSCQPTAPPMGTPGGTGAISINLNIGKMGQPTSINTVNSYRAPIQRKRQVTPADIAADRPAAEKAAGGPVTNINAPIINKLMPGHTIYSAPDPKGKSNPAVVVVDPNGQPHVLPQFGPLFQYVHKQFGKLTTEQQVRSMAHTFLSLVTSMFPNYKFDAVQESDIKVKTLDGGGFELMATVYVAGDKTKFFYTHWLIGPKGAIYRFGFYPKGLSE